MVNALLLSLFAVQHSGMARKKFKQVLTRAVPQEMERSTYVFATCGALALMFAFWRPLPDVVWSVDSPITAAVVLGFSLVGWAVVAFFVAPDQWQGVGIHYIGSKSLEISFFDWLSSF